MGSIPMTAAYATEADLVMALVCGAGEYGSIPYGGANTGVWYNGCALVSKTRDVGSIPATLAKLDEPQALRYHWFNSNREVLLLDAHRGAPHGPLPLVAILDVCNAVTGKSMSKWGPSPSVSVIRCDERRYANLSSGPFCFLGRFKSYTSLRLRKMGEPQSFGYQTQPLTKHRSATLSSPS